MRNNTVLCAANSYEKKYYLNPDFNVLPQGIKDELQIFCVLFTEEVGGILSVEYDEDGSLILMTEAEENDPYFDEIGAGLKVKALQAEKRELFESLELFYKVFPRKGA